MDFAQSGAVAESSHILPQLPSCSACQWDWRRAARGSRTPPVYMSFSRNPKALPGGRIRSARFGSRRASRLRQCARQWNGDKPIYKRWKEIVALSGVRYRNPYQTRHSFASNLLMLGANPLYVSSQMGHADTTLVLRTYGKSVVAGLDDDRRQRLLRLYRQVNPKRLDEFPIFVEQD